MIAFLTIWAWCAQCASTQNWPLCIYLQNNFRGNEKRSWKPSNFVTGCNFELTMGESNYQKCTLCTTRESNCAKSSHLHWRVLSTSSSWISSQCRKIRERDASNIASADTWSRKYFKITKNVSHFVAESMRISKW